MHLCCVYLNCARGGGGGDGGADTEVGTVWHDVHVDWSSVCSHDAGSKANHLRRGSYCSQRNKRSLGLKYTNHLETKTQKRWDKLPGLIPDWTWIRVATVGFEEKLKHVQCGMPTCWFSGGGSRRFLGWLLQIKQTLIIRKLFLRTLYVLINWQSIRRVIL